VKLRNVATLLAAMAVAVIACSNGSGGSSCCEVGPDQGVPACICGDTPYDGGTCKILSTVGATCTISCEGVTAGGQTASSCSDQ
jgi:hypothetical protein